MIVPYEFNAHFDTPEVLCRRQQASTHYSGPFLCLIMSTLRERLALLDATAVSIEIHYTCRRIVAPSKQIQSSGLCLHVQLLKAV